MTQTVPLAVLLLSPVTPTTLSDQWRTVATVK
jgi:hypothetical protein